MKEVKGKDFNIKRSAAEGRQLSSMIISVLDVDYENTCPVCNRNASVGNVSATTEY